VKSLHLISYILLIIGGLNWLLVGAIAWDIGAIFGGQTAFISRLIYVLVGLAALYEMFTHKKNCKVCGGSAANL
jgi:hypothetical protein